MNIVLFERHELEGERHYAVTLPLADPRAKHLRTVLRCSCGDCFRAGLADGPLGRGEVVALTGEVIRLRFHAECGSPPNAPVRLLLGHPRPIQLQRILRELAAIGVSQVVVSHTELGERSYFQSTIWSGDSIRRLLLEGCSQGGGTRLPLVVREHTLERAVLRLERGEPRPAARLVLHPAPGGSRLAAAEGLMPPVVLAVGSERGWSTAELALLESGGYLRVRLGERVLRTETAVVAATAVLLGRLHLL